jgi:adenylate cyclase
MSEGRRSILIVDDAESNVDILVDTLSHDYDLFVAMDGERGLEVARVAKPDLILLDIVMPGMDGYQVCTLLKDDPLTRDIPIIFLTALTEIANKAKGFDLGAVDYVTKPFETVEVKARVQTHLSLKQARESLELLAKDLEIRNKFIRKTFGRYLSEQIVKSILESPDGLTLGGQKRIVTLMMSDLRGFTSITESLPAESVVRIINIYLEAMTEIILRYGGTIDEFIGDAILSIFGAPLACEDHACRAAACALEMQIAIGKVNEELQKMGYPKIAMGIGLNTGEVVVGNIGSHMRAKYGVVGRSVNLTSRIESYTIAGQVFISESTRRACGPIIRIKEEFEVMPKGVSKPLTICELIGIEGDYNIFLPWKSEIEMVELPEPFTVRFSILTGKDSSEKGHFGEIIKLHPQVAEIRSDYFPGKLADLRITLYDRLGTEITADLYAKVIENRAQVRTGFTVGFTSVPPEVEVFLQRSLDQLLMTRSGKSQD